jgi:hypothetical protein
MMLSQFRVVMTIPPVSWAEGSAPIEVKQANQMIAIRFLCVQMVCQRGQLARRPEIRSIMNEQAFFERSHFRAISSTQVCLNPGSA